MEFFDQIREGNSEVFEQVFFISLALILAFGTIQTTGSALETERPVVSVISCSMYPVYNVGDILVVEGKEFQDIEVGDIAIYRVPEKVELNVDGENYVLEKNSPDRNSSASTSAGEIELLRVESGKTGNVAVLKIDGKKIAFTPGMNRKGVEVSDITGQPVPIVHRVIEKSEKSLKTKGDANQKMLKFEEDIRPYQIYGTTAFKIPRLGAIKIIAMDLVGFNGDAPLVIDNTPTCQR